MDGKSEIQKQKEIKSAIRLLNQWKYDF